MPMGSWGCPYLPRDGIKPSADQENLVADRGDKRVRRHRGPIAMSSYYRYECICVYFLHCEGIARASRSRVTFVRQSAASCVLRMVFVRRKYRWHRWSHEVNTKMTRLDKMASRWPPDALRRAKLTHEVNTKMNHREEFGKFFDCQRFENAHEVAPDVWKTRPAIVRSSTIAYDVLTNGLISIRSHPKLENFLFLPIRVSIGSQHRDSVTPALKIKLNFRSNKKNTIIVYIASDNHKK